MASSSLHYAKITSLSSHQQSMRQDLHLVPGDARYQPFQSQSKRSLARQKHTELLSFLHGTPPQDATSLSDELARVLVSNNLKLRCNPWLVVNTFKHCLLPLDDDLQGLITYSSKWAKVRLKCFRGNCSYQSLQQELGAELSLRDGVASQLPALLQGTNHQKQIPSHKIDWQWGEPQPGKEGFWRVANTHNSSENSLPLLSWLHLRQSITLPLLYYYKI